MGHMYRTLKKVSRPVKPAASSGFYVGRICEFTISLHTSVSTQLDRNKQTVLLQMGSKGVDAKSRSVDAVWFSGCRTKLQRPQVLETYSHLQNRCSHPLKYNKDQINLHMMQITSLPVWKCPPPLERCRFLTVTMKRNTQYDVQA